MGRRSARSAQDYRGAEPARRDRFPPDHCPLDREAQSHRCPPDRCRTDHCPPDCEPPDRCPPDREAQSHRGGCLEIGRSGAVAGAAQPRLVVEVEPLEPLAALAQGPVVAGVLLVAWSLTT